MCGSLLREARIWPIVWRRRLAGWLLAIIVGLRQGSVGGRVLAFLARPPFDANRKDLGAAAGLIGPERATSPISAVRLNGKGSLVFSARLAENLREHLRE